MPLIKPTVGRNVLAYVPGGQPRAAIICYVHSDTCINACVFDENGNPHSSTSLALWDGEGERPHYPHAYWMDYQKGQAAKTEELERTVAMQAKSHPFAQD